MKLEDIKFKLEHIGFYTLTDKRARESSHTSQLKRCELILTSACNFNCPYCMPLSPGIRGTMPFNNAFDIIEKWTEHGLESLRFSGGEPTLYKNLHELVIYAKTRGVKNIAISTNGSADLDYYEYLHDCGMNDFSISLDAGCCSTGDMMTGSAKSGTWDKVTFNIREISKFSYVTVGVVLNEKNIEEVLDTIILADAMGVDDIRIISAAQYNRYIPGLEQIPNSILDRHPILRYRVQHYLEGRNVRGMTEHDCKKCKLVLDDMIVAGNYHFPCVIYMRQHGEPIGTIDDKSMDEIRAERLAWYNDTDTHEEEICKRTCLDVCVSFNNVAVGMECT